MLKYTPNNFTGINYNSPTVKGIMQQQQSFNQQLPYSMTPHIGNIGGQGYNNPYLQCMNNPQYYNNMMNGGYYSGYYNYDPIAIRQQMEEERKAKEAEMRNNIDIQKMKNRLYNTYYNIETDEDYLEELYNPNTYTEINKDLQDFEEMRRLSEISNDPSRQVNPNIMAMNNISKLSQDIRSKHPVDQSFADFMNSAGDLYREALINENARELRKNIGNTYDRNAYNQLANMHRQSSFASLRENASIDDLSISLPAHLRGDKEYQQRKNEFLNFITRNDIRNRGGV